MNWIIKTDRYPGIRFSPSRDIIRIRELSTRRWSVAEGDYVLLVSGSSLSMRFYGLSRVAIVSHSENETSPRRARHEYLVGLTDISLFEITLTLEDLVYSLTKVANFSRPSLHVRHRTTITDEDLGTVRTGRLAIQRTVYFGLLSNLEPDWRGRFDSRARLTRATLDVRQSGLAHSTFDEALPPLKELLFLLEISVVDTSRMAAVLADDWSALFPHDSNVIATGAPSADWRFLEFARLAHSSTEDIERHWRQLSELLSSSDSLDERERTWRPHYW